MELTIEQAQERILELEGQVSELTNERDTLSQDKESLARDLEKARTLNQKLFERVSQQDAGEPPEPEPDPAPTCEEFAASIII